MAKLSSKPYVVLFALLPYLIAANAPMVVGWVCDAGPHIEEIPCVQHHFSLMSLINGEWPCHSETNHDGTTQDSHCCTCSGVPLMERDLGDHAVARAYSSLEPAEPGTEISPQISCAVEASPAEIAIDSPFNMARSSLDSHNTVVLLL
ncbi:hypothetical protein ACFL2Q_18475 [Thermodesulfobacteriota bacterium]